MDKKAFLELLTEQIRLFWIQFKAFVYVMIKLRLSLPNSFITATTETLTTRRVWGGGFQVKEDYLSVKLKPILTFHSHSSALIV